MSSRPSVTLGDATISLSSRRIPVKELDRKPGPYPYWGASGVVDYVDHYIFDHPALLVSEDGENLRSRKTPIAFLTDGKYWVNNHAHVLVAAPGFDLRFLYYFVSTYDFDGNGLITGSGQPKLNAANLARTPVPLLAMDEQRRIAGVLGAFDDLIETNRRTIASLEQLIHTLFERGQFDKPLNGDRSIAVGELLWVNPPIGKPQGEAPYVDMGMLPTDGALLPPPGVRPARGGARFSNGDTLLARITPCLENGKTAYVTSLREQEVGVGSTEFIVLRGRNGTAGVWSYCLARSPRFRTFAIQQLGDGTSGRQRLSADAVSNYRLAVPDEAELARFRSETEPLLRGMIGLHEETQELTRERNELLPLLLSGKVRVSDVEGVL